MEAATHEALLKCHTCGDVFASDRTFSTYCDSCLKELKALAALHRLRNTQEKREVK